MTVWPRLDQLEKHIKRLTVALTMMAVAMCVVVTMGRQAGRLTLVTMATVTPDPTVADNIEITTEFVMHLANIVTYLAVHQEYLVLLTP